MIVFDSSVVFVLGLTLLAQGAVAEVEPDVAAPVEVPAATPATPAATETGASPPTRLLDDITVTAAEPLWVAPTRRDQIGRIWAPVMVNGQGPFRFVLATGASHSAITAQVATALHISQDERNSALLLGVTGSTSVPMVPIESLEIGELLMLPRKLPIVPDALGGAQGILGTEDFANKRIHIDFRRDRISIRRSRSQRADPGFLTVPVTFMRGKLLVVDAQVGGVPTKAIIDTGGQATLGNLALKNALAERRKGVELVPEEVTGATLDIQMGDRATTPSLYMGKLIVRNPAMTFADFAIFEQWKMIKQPTIIVGMDVLGHLETLIIDYRLKELQIRLRR